MLKLDAKQPFGTIHPPLTEAGFDRPAHFEQGNKYFDQHGRQIVAGQPLPDAAPPVDANIGATVRPAYTPTELIVHADTIPWAEFAHDAKLILGAKCPAGKEAIVVALRKAVAGFEEKRRNKRERDAVLGTRGAASEVPDADPPDTTQGGQVDLEALLPPAQHGATSKPPPVPKKGAVDLKAWAMGHADYLISEVRKAIRQQYAKQISGENERADMVAFLVEVGCITAEQARKDV